MSCTNKLSSGLSWALASLNEGKQTNKQTQKTTVVKGGAQIFALIIETRRCYTRGKLAQHRLQGRRCNGRDWELSVAGSEWIIREGMHT